MDEKIVVLAALLGLTAENVDAAYKAEKPEAFVGLINNYKSTLPNIDALKKNIIADRDRELVGLAKTANLPPELYGVIKGAVFEMEEKKIAKAHNVTDYKDMDDLISKIATKDSNGDVTELTKKLTAKEKEFEALKAVNLELDSKFKNLDSDYAKKYSQKELSEMKAKVFDSIEARLKGTVEEKKNRRELLESAFNNRYTIKVEDGKNVVYEGDKPVRNVNLEPLPLNDITESFVTKYGFEFVPDDEGGRGADGAKKETSTKFKGMDTTAFEKYLSDNKLMNTPEADKALLDWKEANKV